jgi:hypothetical protein
MELIPGEIVRYDDDVGIETAQLRITVEGITPLLLHNPAGMSGATKGPQKGERVFDPKEEAERGTYRLETGQLAIPGAHFRGALLLAAGGWKKAKGRGSIRANMAHVTVAEDLIGLVDHNGQPLTTYDIDTRRAIVQRSGILRSRPKLNLWRAIVTFNFEEKMITPNLIVGVLADAGNNQGVGDYRPNKNGPYGRFKIVEYMLV